MLRMRTAVTHTDVIMLSLEYDDLHKLLQNSLKESKFKSKFVMDNLNSVDMFKENWSLLDKLKISLYMRNMSV
jgi:hypothetical protein